MPDISRTEEHRRRVAGWTPVVKVQQDTRLRVAIVGRMNAGKSSLFNLLAASRSGPTQHQLVKDFEGLTRDAVESLAELGDIPFTIIDTPGLVGGKLVEEAMNTIATADLAFFVTAVDRDLTLEEYHLAKFLQARKIPTVLLVNKMDLIPSERFDEVLMQYEQLSLGKALPISLRERGGLEQLEACIEPFYHLHNMRRTEADWALEDLALEGDERAMGDIRDRNSNERVIRVAIIGKPCSGKSSLLNRLVGYERSRASDEKNTTRDSVEINCTYKGRKLALIDTAGLMKMKNRRDNDFRNSIHRTAFMAVKYAHVVVCVFDATEGHPSNVDMKMLLTAHQEGRPSILVANKWDIVMDPTATAEAIDFKIKRQDKEAKYVTAVVCSAHTGLNLTMLLDQVVEHYDRWNTKLRNTDINKFWKRFEKSVAIPSRTSRIGRIIQSKARPPTFVLQLQSKNDEVLLARTTVEMVKNALIEEFGYKGVPIRVIQDFKDPHPDFI